MQSVNRTVERTLGLARNVPFSFGEITIYLQVHVIKDPGLCIREVSGGGMSLTSVPSCLFPFMHPDHRL